MGFHNEKLDKIIGTRPELCKFSCNESDIDQLILDSKDSIIDRVNKINKYYKILRVLGKDIGWIETKWDICKKVDYLESPENIEIIKMYRDPVITK